MTGQKIVKSTNLANISQAGYVFRRKLLSLKNKLPVIYTSLLIIIMFIPPPVLNLKCSVPSRPHFPQEIFKLDNAMSCLLAVII